MLLPGEYSSIYDVEMHDKSRKHQPTLMELLEFFARKYNVQRLMKKGLRYNSVSKRGYLKATIISSDDSKHKRLAVFFNIRETFLKEAST